MAVTYEQASTSTEFIRIAVSATEEGEFLDVTSGAVTAMFLAEDAAPPTAASVNWEPATWETDATTTPDTYYARVVVGPSPGEVQLAAGVWQPWVKIVTAFPETVIRKAAGQVRIV